MLNQRRIKEQDMNKEQEIQKAFNDCVGAILTYLDEAGVGFATKKAIKAELYELCDKKVKPLMAGLGAGHDNDYDNRFNR